MEDPELESHTRFPKLQIPPTASSTLPSIPLTIPLHYLIAAPAFHLHPPSSFTTSINTMSLEAIAAARKRKLALLRSSRDSPSSSPHALIKRHFRNYDPSTGQFRRHPLTRPLPDTVEANTANIASETIAEHEKGRKEDLDLTNIAPKRPNWDLKRDLQRRLKKLERKDREAVMVLIRRRVRGEQKKVGEGKGEEGVTGLGAEIVATATRDLDATTGEVSEESGEGSEGEEEARQAAQLDLVLRFP